MAELSDVRCYQCGRLIPEGEIVRREVRTLVARSADGEVIGSSRESFCPACDTSLKAEAAVERRRQAKDGYYLRVGCIALVVASILVAALYVGVALLVRWYRHGW